MNTSYLIRDFEVSEEIAEDIARGLKDYFEQLDEKEPEEVLDSITDFLQNDPHDMIYGIGRYLEGWGFDRVVINMVTPAECAYPNTNFSILLDSRKILVPCDFHGYINASADIPFTDTFDRKVPYGDTLFEEIWGTILDVHLRNL